MAEPSTVAGSRARDGPVPGRAMRSGRKIGSKKLSPGRNARIVPAMRRDVRSSLGRAMSIALGLGSVAVLAISSAAAQTVNDPGLLVETVATGLSQPTSMAFIGPDDILVLQKPNGQVRRITGGVLQPGFVLDVAVDSASE